VTPITAARLLLSPPGRTVTPTRQSKADHLAPPLRRDGNGKLGAVPVPLAVLLARPLPGVPGRLRW